MFDIVIIGGGASGLFLAGKLLKHNYSVAIIESNDRVGKKLLATGNGRCNLSNRNITTAHYNNVFVNNALNNCPTSRVINEFYDIGLAITEEEGRIYPYSYIASSVLDVLRLATCNATFFMSTTAIKIEKFNNAYTVSCKGDNAIDGKRIILASGSNATFGINSLHLLNSLGHKTTTLTPSLCPMPCDKDAIKGLGGVRHHVEISLFIKGAFIHKEKGEILFKQTSLSGIAIFNISSLMARLDEATAQLSIDFFPDYSVEQIGELQQKGILQHMVHKNIFALISDTPNVSKAKNYRINIMRNSDFSQGQVVSGGLDTNDFDPTNMMSTLCNNLFAIGEALDVDGECGGYNLHWAWASALATCDFIIKNNNK